MKKFITLFLLVINAKHDEKSYYSYHNHWLDDSYNSAAFYKWHKQQNRLLIPTDYRYKKLKKHKSGTLGEHYSGRYDS